jgi:hypothetical protein
MGKLTRRLRSLAVRIRGRKPPRPPLLSVLIASIPSRGERFLLPLLRELEAQIGESADVEVLTLIDNRHMTIGDKRNRLRTIAAGRYSVFVDDDDRVSSDYVASILHAIRSQPGRDVYCFDVWVCGYDRVGIGGPEGMVCKYGSALQHANLADRFTRKPNHLMVFRTELARRVQFPDTSYGEDDAWGARIARHVRTEGRIDRVLYHYDFSVETSETPWSQAWRARQEMRKQGAATEAQPR